MKKKKIKFKPLRAAGNLIVYAYALILILPFYFALVTSFKSESERVQNPIGFPESLNLSNYITAWTEGNLLMAAKNSIIICTTSTLLLILNVIVVSYCLNCIRDAKIGTFLYLAILLTMFVPGVGNVTGLMMRRSLGLYNNLFGEIFCGALGITTGVFLTSGFLRTIPRELEEAAKIDGANDIQTCMHVIVPVIKPVLVSVAVLDFTGKWNNALGPMLTLRNEELFTIPMALLLNFTTETSVKYTTLFAGVIMTAIPLIIVYCKCQKYFISAVAGSVKG